MNIAPVERFSDATLRLPPCALAPSPHIHLYVGEHTAALLPACSSSSPFRESTRDDYRRDLRRYVLPYFDGKQRKRVDEITPRDAAEFVGWLCDAAEQGRRVAVERRKAKAQKLRVSPGSLPLESQPLHLADASVRRIFSPLRACMGSAVAEGVTRSNPTLGVALPARDEQRAIDVGTDEEEHQVKALSTEELAAFLMVCPERWETFFRLLAATGLRVSEAFALRWRDLQLDGSKPHVRVRRAYVRGRFGPPKSRYGKRAVPIDHTLVIDPSSTAQGCRVGRR